MLDILEEGDYCTLGITVFILLWLGGMIADPTAKKFSGGIAVMCFVGYGVYALLEMPPKSGADVLGITLRSLIAFGGTLGLAWIILPVLLLAYRFTVGAMIAMARRVGRAIWSYVIERRRRLQESAERQFAEADFACSAPDRERARKEADERANRRDQDRRRRETARAACEVLFELHAWELASRFTREMFDEFVRRHLGDDKAPELVEERAQLLQAIIRKHVEKVEPSEKPPATAELDAARREVETCYSEYAALLREAFPPIALHAELRARITDKASAEDAWNQARDMIHEILELVAEEREHQRQQQTKKGVNPPLDTI